MKLITKMTDYAIRALLYLGKNQGRFVSSREIAEAEHISISFIRRILQDLGKAKIVGAKEGINGGITLKKDPNDIYLSDVIVLFQGEIQLADCLFRKQICENRNACVLRRRIKNIEDKVVSEFSGISIADLLNDI